VRPVGELDLATVPVLEAEMRELQQAGFRRLVLDLGGLSFMDSTGLAMVVRWDLDARSDGFTFALLPGRPHVQRLFDLTGLTGRLPFGDGRAG
jgi:anti-sigma B factor antagonist